jgi:hypothetical protein
MFAELIREETADSPSNEAVKGAASFVLDID